MSGEDESRVRAAAGGGALAGLRVVDLTDDTGRFAAKLLAEAGADVVRIGRGSPGPALGGRIAGGLLDWWYDAGKLAVDLDLASESGREGFRALVGGADLLIETEPPGRLASLGIDFPELERGNPRLVQVSLTPFGRTGPRAGWQTSDLVASALGGVLSVTGTPDAPLAGWGRQGYNTGGFFAAISGLAAVYAACRTGRGQHVDLSLHECVAACTEQVMMYWFFPSIFAAIGKSPIAERQGALHWSGAYDVMRCRDGYCMVSPSPLGGLPALLNWLSEDGLGSDLPEIDVSNPVALLAGVGRLMELMRAWTRNKTAAEVFNGGQERRLCFGEVLTPARVAALPQLGARGFFRRAGADGRAVALPGPLFKMAATPAVEPRPPAAATLEEALRRWRNGGKPGVSGAPPPARPLAGIRVLDFTWVLAGPYATRVLADLGADVVKLQTEERSQGVNANSFPYFVMWNRSKRSVMLNLKHPRAADVFLRLVKSADVVIDNFSAGVLDRLGIGYARASEHNPRIIYLSMAGCGQNGPWRDFVTFAPTIQALCGITYLTNPPQRSDVGYGFAMTDHLSGLAGALALLEALMARERSGKGQAIDLAQLEVGAYLVGPAFVELLSNGVEPQPRGNADPFDDFVPNEVYRCRGEEWLAVTARSDREWISLCHAIGRLDLAADRRLGTVEGRRAARSEIDAALSAWARGEDGEAAMHRLQGVGVPAGLVQTARDWVERDEQLAARGWFREVEHSLYGKLPVDAFPAKFGLTPLDSYSPAPLFGEHNFEVYPELLGMTEAEIAEAVADGLFS
jgi:crotonobetainyl-CoA:carnitine CoA-transferase CaiB-like acyl-CoA transferase